MNRPPSTTNAAERAYSMAWCLGIFVIAVAAVYYLRFVLYPDRLLTLSYALPLLLCLWQRNRVLLWSMAGVFISMATYKALSQISRLEELPGVELLDWSMQVINVVVVGTTVHLALHWMSQLRQKNAALAESAEEISRQNEELQAQSEELAQQGEEIQSQAEKVAQQNEELQQHTEELQMQTEELQVLNAELAERERMLQILLEAVQTKADEPAVMERVCQSLRQLLGVPQSAAAVLERSAGEFVVQAQSGLADLQRDRWPVEQSFSAVVLEQQRTAFIEDLRLRPDLVTPVQGATEFQSLLATPLIQDGQPMGIVEVYAAAPRRWTKRDFAIIEWVAAQAALILQARRLRADLEQANVNLEKLVADRTAKLREIVGELEHFSYTITHDMRAPLRAMQGFAALLQEEFATHPNEQCREYVQRINTVARRMDQLITDALSYSQAVQHEIQLSTVDPTKLLLGIIESYPAFQPPQACIELAGSLPPVIANEAGLTQCFSNLLGNAVKFVSPGKQPVVRIRAEKRENKVRICFEDNGIGVAPEMRSRIFGMFQRGSREFEGTGIGLALVRKVAERMGGKVGFDSEPGRGSQFWLELQCPDPQPTP